MKEGHPAAVMPGADPGMRILADLGWLQKQGQIGAPVDPVARQRAHEHMDGSLAVFEANESHGGEAIGAEDCADGEHLPSNRRQRAKLGKKDLFSD